ncbi:MAG: tripartite tricarboxylate transporter substrate binding protein [Burkholderiaceae bacterium]
MMHRRSIFIAGGAGLALAAVGAQAQSGTWPDRPLKFITPYPPGGLSDQITRYVGDRVSRAVGQPVIVENKPGAGAALGTEYAAHAAPDGYNFFVAPTATVCVAPWIRKVNFSIDDFAPVAKLTSSYGLITTRKNAPFNTYREFVAAAKAAPGKYTFATNGVGSIVHLTAVLLHKKAGIELVHVPYKGSMESMTDLIGGRIDLMYDPVTAPRVRDGILKALAVTNDDRYPLLPEVTTLKEQGYDLDTRSWFGVFAPKATPANIVARMSSEIKKIMAGPTVRADMLVSSMYPDYEDAEGFGRRARSDSDFFRDIIQKEGIKGD